MLQQLLIKNYALIRHLEIKPSSRLNIITGETGAGKSIMLGALGLLLGDRADVKSLYADDEKCVIEGTFRLKEYALESLFDELDIDYEEVTLLRREISPSGKSRAFVNDTPVRLEVVRELGKHFIDVHSQHETLQLGTGEYQLQLIDAYGGLQPLLSEYSAVYQQYQQKKKAYNELLGESERSQADLDYQQHQLTELIEAELDDFNQVELEQELEKLENAESIKLNLQQVLQIVSEGEEMNVESQLQQSVQLLAQISNFGPNLEQMSDRLNSVFIELQDLSTELQREEEALFLDEEAIQLAQDRLNRLYTLQKKHRVQSAEELIALRDELNEKVNRALNFDDELEDRRIAMEEALAEVQAVGGKLSTQRQAQLEPLRNEIESLLKNLGMADSRFVPTLTECAPSPQGLEEAALLFSANKGVKERELVSVASGGEFSRLMLSIKHVLARKTALPTIVFDEIDTGVSGEIAMKMGRMMQEMAAHHQIIVISHLPQIAALGDQHYFVFKDTSAARAESRIKLLLEHERVNEIAQMIGGANPSKTAFINARELMGIGK